MSNKTLNVSLIVRSLFDTTNRLLSQFKSKVMAKDKESVADKLL